MENPFELILDKLARIEYLLSNLRAKEPEQNLTPEPSLFTIDQAAKYLCLAKSSVYKMTAERTIPHFKLSKRVYFKPKDLEEWVSRSKIKTVQEIEQEADGCLRKKYRRK